MILISVPTFGQRPVRIPLPVLAVPVAALGAAERARRYG
jgi:hypothetical protein